MDVRNVTRQDVAEIVHSHSDSRYESEFYLYADLLVDAINEGCLALKEYRATVPEIAKGGELGHGELVAAMERVLEKKFRSWSQEGYGCVTERGYSIGQADVAICKPGQSPILAVEVGEVYTGKPLECFYGSDLQELWICPYQESGASRILKYYVIRRGPCFQLLEQYWDAREIELKNRLPNLLKGQG